MSLDGRINDSFSVTILICEIYCFPKFSPELYPDLLQYFKPWINYYPWSSGLVPNLTQVNEYFITGSLHYNSDLLNDEWLLINLIKTFISSRNDNVYFRFYEEEFGEFLLSEAPELIPDWCDPENAHGRLWYNDKNQLVLIPPKDPRDATSLKDDEALEILNKKNYLIDNNSLKEVSEKIDTRLENIIEGCLQEIVCFEIIVSEKLASWIIENQQTNISCLAIQAILKGLESFDYSKLYHETEEKISIIEEKVNLKISLPVYYYKLLEYNHSKLKSKKLFIEYVGGLINDNFPKSFEYTPVNNDIDSYNSFISSNPLQRSLIEKKIITSIISPIDLNNLAPPKTPALDQDIIDEEELIDKVKGLLSKDLDLDEEYNDDSDYESDKENQQVINYFKNQNMESITEDDFFEYLLVNGLKVSKEELENYKTSDEDNDKKRKLDNDDTFDKLEQLYNLTNSNLR